MAASTNHPSPPNTRLAHAGRALLAILALFLALGGLVSWAIETEYGGAPDRNEYVVSQEGDGPVIVYDNSEMVFEGTQSDVDQWLSQQRGGRNSTVPLLLTGGALALLTIAFWPIIRQLSSQEEDGRCKAR